MKIFSRALLLAAALVLPAISFAGVYVSITLAPPILPVYAQPVCPGEGYIWTPGYWAWGDYGYYWVPGTWVLAPTVGYLWTPGYWGWVDGIYVWNGGYWGPHVGFYGGVNYGYGYGGHGYEGGRWNNGVFNYNRSVNNVNVANIHNTYNGTVVNNVTVNRVSYNGGAGGVRAQPTSQEVAAARDNHIGATGPQMQHEQAARADRSLRASENHGRPAIAATPRPGAFNDRGVVRASQGRMASSNFAPHAQQSGNNGQRSAPGGNNSPRTAERPPSAGYAPRDRAQSGAVPGDRGGIQRQAQQRPPNVEGGAMNREPPRQAGPAPRPQQEHRREER